MKTTWLLDVDGVLNVDRLGPWGISIEVKHIVVEQKSLSIRYAPELLKRIRALSTSGKVDILWCTSWVAYPEILLDLFNLPAVAVAFSGRLNGTSLSQAKMMCAMGVVDSGDRLIWTDSSDVPKFGPMANKLTSGNGSLLIRPNERYGLMPGHMRQIEEFCV